MSLTDSKLYIRDKVNPILEPMIIELLKKCPQNVTNFIIGWLQDYNALDASQKATDLYVAMPNMSSSKVVKESKEYLKSKVNPIIELMVVDLLKDRPHDLPQFMANWLKNKGVQIESELGEVLEAPN